MAQELDRHTVARASHPSLSKRLTDAADDGLGLQVAREEPIGPDFESLQGGGCVPGRNEKEHPERVVTRFGPDLPAQGNRAVRRQLRIGQHQIAPSGGQPTESPGGVGRALDRNPRLLQRGCDLLCKPRVGCDE
jgi:hypothetical protein